jgi:hypothetical protein
MMPEMPFADACRPIASPLEQFGHRRLTVVYTDLRLRSQCAEDADPFVDASGHQGSSRGAADGGGDNKVGESSSLARHLVEVGCQIGVASKAPYIGVSQVIDEQQNDIGRFFSRVSREKGMRQDGETY